MACSRRRLPVVFVCAVCMSGPWVSAAPPAGHAHAHPEAGPHRGTLIDLGRGEYHAELVHDHANDAITVHLLDATATKPVAIAAKRLTLNVRSGGKPWQFSLAAAAQPGDAPGVASAFVGKGGELLRVLDAPDASGRLNVEIGGKVYGGRVSGHAHGHEH